GARRRHCRGRRPGGTARRRTEPAGQPVVLAGLIAACLSGLRPRPPRRPGPRPDSELGRMTPLAAVGALGGGIRRACAAGRVVLLLSLGNLALAVAASAALALLTEGGTGQALVEFLAARPLDLNIAVELGAAQRGASLYGAPPHSSGALAWIVLAGSP